MTHTDTTCANAARRSIASKPEGRLNQCFSLVAAAVRDSFNSYFGTSMMASDILQRMQEMDLAADNLSTGEIGPEVH